MLQKQCTALHCTAQNPTERYVLTDVQKSCITFLHYITQHQVPPFPRTFLSQPNPHMASGLMLAVLLFALCAVCTAQEHDTHVHSYDTYRDDGFVLSTANETEGLPSNHFFAPCDTTTTATLFNTTYIEVSYQVGRYSPSSDLTASGEAALMIRIEMDATTPRWAAVGLRPAGVVPEGMMTGLEIVASDTTTTTAYQTSIATGNTMPSAAPTQQMFLLTLKTVNGKRTFEYIRPFDVADNSYSLGSGSWDVAYATGEGTALDTWTGHSEAVLLRNDFSVEQCSVEAAGAADEEDDDGLSGGALAGIVVGAVVFVLLVVGAVLFIIKSRSAASYEMFAEVLKADAEAVESVENYYADRPTPRYESAPMPEQNTASPFRPLNRGGVGAPRTPPPGMMSLQVV